MSICGAKVTEVLSFNWIFKSRHCDNVVTSGCEAIQSPVSKKFNVCHLNDERPFS